MKPRVRRAAIAGALTISALAGFGCAPKRPILFAASDFKSHKVLNGGTAFFLTQPIDITSTLRDYVAAFDGDVHTGAAFTEGCLRAYLTGGEAPDARYSFDLHLPDMAALVSPDSITACVKTKQDEYGLTQTDVDTTALARLLLRRHVEHLILICEPNVSRGSSVHQPVLVTVPTSQPTSGIFGGGEEKFANLDAQVLIWDGPSKKLIWNGFVQGKHPISMKFTKNTARGVASAFAEDLYEALQ